MEGMERMERPSPLTPELNEVFLRRLKETRQSLGFGDSKVEIRFEGLNVEADAQVGLRTPPTLLNVTLNTMQELTELLRPSSTNKKPIRILNGLTGVIKPSRMTLILGPPGSGKSTFLRALSKKLDPAFKISGKVTFNEQELKPSTSEQLCMYVSQHDLHHAEMTVRDTLNFSSHMFGTNKAFEILSGVPGTERASTNKLAPEIDELLEATSCGEGSNLTTNYILKLLGLEDCANIIVGDEMRRGISGGQKKRVTIGEMLISLARSFFMDDISTGLDSSTTYMIVKFLRQIAHIMDTTMVISLIQPSAETFELFDDIILLCKGQIVYQGRRENILEFFEYMGFKCPDRKNIADFLQEVTSKMDQEQYWKDNQREYQYVSVEKFAESFCCYYLDQHLEDKQHIIGGYTKSVRTIATSENYRISNWKVFKACFSREVLLLKMNSPVHIFKSIQIMILALVTMTLFLRTNMDHHSIAGGNKFIGAIFTGVVIVNFNGMTELAMIVKRLPVFYKQRELMLLPGWALLFSIYILSIPLTLIETGIWTSLTYFVIGYAPSATRFFQQYLAFLSVHQMSMGLFRLIAAIGKTQMMANTLGTAALISIYILAGFVLSRDDIQPWLKWGYWSSPLTYGQNAVALNEFLDERWNKKMYDNSNETIGEVFLRSRGLLTQWHWYWISIGALAGFSLIFNILTIFALEYSNNPYKHKVTASTEVADLQLNGKDNEQQGDGRVSTPLPFQPLNLVFQHISYYVDMPKGMKKDGNGKRLQLLRDVSGAFRPGILTALMGITGAGKTTLLDVLAGRKTGGYIEGNISISGYPKKQEAFARISGYCEQTDIHSPFLTVHESLHLSAWLRLPSHVEQHDRNMFVEEVMCLVELLPLKKAIVGLPGAHGLSAEQRKRLSIAVELVASPSIIFMDEPTTGLDARAAAIVMRTVRKTVDTGRTVVCTIHQPSIEIFEAFDELLLMKSGGQLIYSGPLGPFSQTMINYFEAIPGVAKIRKDQNPATWMLDITSTIIEYNQRIDYAGIYRNSSLYRDNMEMVEDLSKRRPNLEEPHFLTTCRLSFKVQCLACLWKQNRSYWKNPEHNIVRFATTVTTSLLFGVVFWQIGSKMTKEQDIFNVLGIMYGSALFLGFANASIVQPVVGTERTVLYRERAAGMYSTLPSAIAQVAIEIPYIIVQVLIFSSTVYTMAGFQLVVSKFLWFVLFMLLSFFYFTLFGMMAVALTPIQDVAALLSFLIFILWNLFSGFMLPRKLIPTWWRWYYWANPAAWTIYGLLFSQLGDRVELIQIPGGTDQTIKEFLEDYLGVESTYFPIIVTLHFGIIVLFFILFVVGIKHLNFQKK
ncbi:ABC transporter G family member 45 isoform X1 [Dendrobium catenatum]|nr:ABC transporter G family member 45 isoform X1 [Dendrobium catenatum]